MVDFERTLASEDLDAAEIVRGILTVQARFAADEHRSLGRGTHTKGICARAQLEIFDVGATIGDPALASRLAKGLFAVPGVYPATLRFANAASTVNRDSKADLRAMSFSVELPAGLSSITRQDFSLQNASTFPLNDSHVFALVLRVLSAEGAGGMLKTLGSLPIRDLWRFFRALSLGIWQGLGKARPYQAIRSWSTVPFRHGPFDAAKYSAIPLPSNPAQPLSLAPDALQQELVRHLNEDAQMSAFDIGVQLLDVERMTHWGRHREASYWIENGLVEWHEDQTPFHIVGRLTLVRQSVLEPDACEATAIDVNQNSTADSQPLGSLNRVRRAGELASRRVRRGEITADELLRGLPPAPPPGSVLGALMKAAAVLFIAAIVGIGVMHFAAGAIYEQLSASNIPTYERVDQVRYLNQGWGIERESADREAYYYTPQGASMHGIRYSWFVNLERPFNRQRLADPDHLRSLNFLVDPAPTHSNPDQLPVGFTRHYDDTLNDWVADITCAACHTGQLHVTRNGQTTAIRIDGGQAMTAFTDMKPGHFQLEVGLALAETFINPLKFNRFAARVLAPNARTWKAKWTLWRAGLQVLRELKNTTGAQELAHDQSREPANRLYPVQEGFGRTDAIARITNAVFGDHMDSKNYRTGDAPVSFPYLWNIWKFDWVQYTASVSQPMARNVGESMGTGADYRLVDDYGQPIAASERYRTTISFDNLLRIESTLQKLTPPRWPAELLGSIDQAAAARGKQLFEQHCHVCHGPWVSSQALKHSLSPGRTAADPMWVIRTKEVNDIGTDPTAANNFFRNRVDVSRTGLTFDEVKALLAREYGTMKTRQADLVPALQQERDRRKAAGADADTLSELDAELKQAQGYGLTDASIAQIIDGIDLTRLNVGSGLNILGLVIRERYYTDRHFSDEARACFEGFGTLDLPQVVDGYKPRPLEGVWATPPFLHNGSVPNLYELLSPASERTTRFFVGRREFDPVKVGYVTQPLPASGGFWLDTRVSGNLNTGHEFRDGYVPYDEVKRIPAGGIIGPALTPQQRMDVIEYLKIHRDEPVSAAADKAARTPPDCSALLK